MRLLRNHVSARLGKTDPLGLYPTDVASHQESLPTGPSALSEDLVHFIPHMLAAGRFQAAHCRGKSNRRQQVAPHIETSQEQGQSAAEKAVRRPTRGLTSETGNGA